MIYFVFVIMLIKATTTTPPMAWNFECTYPMMSTQQASYNTLKHYDNFALKPILFGGNDSTADYSGETWRDPCYHRFYAQNATYVIYWQVENDFCSTCSSGRGYNSFGLELQDFIPRNWDTTNVVRQISILRQFCIEADTFCRQ
ncbi:uncharacterized protein CELE_Y38E10A.35 [Caenorhabditis elegans]|uniref:Uncharacterized protein n=1 Tax=Caenorhabditis elegans TaxID=6239 RepID=A0A5S9MNZ5_CAEEL|nr:Uncharacterized protein CELE_Y38E10A.35 [Caenorhabditis elegans]CAA0059175.1 Uncharacterized protein CELE_Y38E10A.35 [Caenorhabditis elegans]